MISPHCSTFNNVLHTLAVHTIRFPCEFRELAAQRNLAVHQVSPTSVSVQTYLMSAKEVSQFWLSGPSPTRFAVSIREIFVDFRLVRSEVG